MNLSYWERKTWLTEIDFAIIGSGIVGLNCALSLRKEFPKAKIVVFEKGILPSGASTKNAGFACFGSLSELLEDFKTHSEQEVIQLVKERVDGLQMLKTTLGVDQIAHKSLGGYELFTKENTLLMEECLDKLPYINGLLKPIFPKNSAVFSVKKDPFGFQNINENLIFNQFEGQIDTGKMMLGLLQKVSEKKILVLNSVEVTSITSNEKHVEMELNKTEKISVKKVCIATNGFAKKLLKEDVTPARAQVLVTKPIKNLKIKGTFHLDKGYYYFRNIDNRILLGGGRNLDFKTEETSELGLTELIQNKLEHILKDTILPHTPFEIDQRWSGIMGVGGQKKPIIKEIQTNIYCGVRLGGMGVAIGSSIGKQLAAITTNK